MEQQLAVNMKRLWELAKDDKSAQEIMAELDITDMAALSNALHGLMQEKGESINAPGLIDKASINREYTDEGKRTEDREKS